MSQQVAGFPWLLNEASTAHEITAHPGKVNGLLEKLSKDNEHALFETAEAEAAEAGDKCCSHCCKMLQMSGFRTVGRADESKQSRAAVPITLPPDKTCRPWGVSDW